MQKPLSASPPHCEDSLHIRLYTASACHRKAPEAFQEPSRHPKGTRYKLLLYPLFNKPLSSSGLPDNFPTECVVMRIQKPTLNHIIHFRFRQ